jgi:WhiB family transcriptional regulator, redox-sensing transcriptional regulator
MAAHVSLAPKDWRAAMADRTARTSRLDDHVVRSAACTQPSVSPDLFFPAPADTAGAERAKKICRTCPVVRECLLMALTTRDEHAVLGATTPDERRKLRRHLAHKRRRAAA